jgi:glycosyltransferase involved in cell wall biosynthesis
VHVREIYAGAGGAVAALLWPALHRRLSTADGLACVSAAVASQFAEVSSAFVLHDGLPRVPRPRDRGEARAALGLPPGPFVVALLGRVSDWKGQDVLARALAEPALAEIGAIGALAGAPYAGNEPLERDLTRLGLELGLGERLQLLGFREDIDTVLGAADAVAVPSTRPDPFPNAALEAAAAGIPVVASSHGGLVEIVRDRATGLLVEPGDHRALAEALRALADDPELRRRLGSAAAVDARERFGIERMLAELQDRYDRLIESAG